jgi:hypothetical protein
MNDPDPARASTLARSLFLVAGALGRDSVRPLRRRASGSVDEALAQADELLQAGDLEMTGRLRAEAADGLLRRNLPVPFIHASWFVEPLRRLPPAMLTPVLSLLPPRLMRAVADLVEERLEIRLGMITLSELSPALARRFALSLLPPCVNPRAAGGLPRALLAEPLAELERNPFPFPEAGVMAVPESFGSEARRRLQEEAGLPAPLAASLTGLAPALASRPEEAACLALRMPRVAGVLFHELSRRSALLVSAQAAEAMYENFRDYTERET